MSQSSEDEDEVVLFANRPEWQDITPIPQHENITPVAPIFYTDECESLVGYLEDYLIVSKIEMQLPTSGQ